MLKGSIVAIVTPMHDDGSIDFDSLHRLVNFHLENGTDGIVSVGTSGESATLSIEEQVDVIAATVKFVAGKIPVIAGTGSNSTAEAIELSIGAKQAGADSSLSVVPYYVKPTQRGIVAHFEAIASAVDIDQILYNVPSRTVVDMSVECVSQLAIIPNITGIKDASGDISRVAYYLEHCGDNFALYSGDDGTTKDFIIAGGHGCISVTANVAPKKMHEMCLAALNKDIALANQLNEALDGLHEILFVEPSPSPAKWAVASMGLCGHGMRLPMVELHEKFHDTMRAAMRRAGVSI